MVGVKAFKDQIPEGDDGGEEPLVKGLGFEGRQAPEGAMGQQLDKAAQELGRGEGGGGSRGGRMLPTRRFWGRLAVCICYTMHTYYVILPR